MPEEQSCFSGIVASEEIMNRQIAIVLMMVLLAMPASAGRRRPVAPVVDDALSIVFVDGQAADNSLTAAGADAWLDVKDLSRNPGSRERGTRVRRRFGVRVVRNSGTASGTVTITARLQSSDGRTQMRLDGKPLTEAPSVVDAHAAIGAVTLHTLEIEINDAIPAGPIAAAISWEVTTQ